MATLKSIKNKYLVPADGTVLGVTTNTENVSLLSFKLATADSLSKFNLVDGASDDYNDATGVDDIASTNEVRNATSKYFSGAVAGNYFGDSSDGALTTSGNVTYTVPNTSGTYDGDMVVKQYSALTVSAGHTITTDRDGSRGLFIYVAGDLVVNGTIHQTRKGGHADPWQSGGSDSNAVQADGLQLGMKTSGGTSSFTNDGTGFNGAGTGVRTAVAASDDISGNGTIYTISRVGGAQGTNGATGAAIISTGGGANGGGFGPSGVGGTGGTGGAFSSGTGGGGAYNATGGAGSSYGGPGGAGTGGSNLGGGAGNPPGSGGGGGPAGDQGAGGILWLVVKGDVTVGAAGAIQARGADAGKGGHGGGASGGGAIHILYGGTYTNNGTVDANKGEFTGGGMGAGSAGNGGVNAAQVSADAFNNMTLQSNVYTAQADPTTIRVMMDEYTSVGSATLDTDIKAYASRDSGTTWTQTPLVSQATIDTNHRFLSGSADVSGQPAGANIKYKIETLNQSVSKQTRVYGTSMAWA